jgi:hypothetical protein
MERQKAFGLKSEPSATAQPKTRRNIEQCMVILTMMVMYDVDVVFIFSSFFQHPNILKGLKSKNSQGRSRKNF